MAGLKEFGSMIVEQRRLGTSKRVPVFPLERGSNNEICVTQTGYYYSYS